jgi:hypothetical protein
MLIYMRSLELMYQLNTNLGFLNTQGLSVVMESPRRQENHPDSRSVVEKLKRLAAKSGRSVRRRTRWAYQREADAKPRSHLGNGAVFALLFSVLSL